MLLLHGPVGTAIRRGRQPSWPHSQLHSSLPCSASAGPISMPGGPCGVSSLQRSSRICSKSGAGRSSMLLGHPPRQRRLLLPPASLITALLYRCRSDGRALGARRPPPARQRKAQCARSACAPRQRREQAPACDLQGSAGRRAEQRPCSGTGQPLWGFDDGHVWGESGLVPAEVAWAQVAATCMQ